MRFFRQLKYLNNKSIYLVLGLIRHFFCNYILINLLITDIVVDRISITPFTVSFLFVNPLSANPTKCPNTLKQFVGNLPANCLSVFGHFVKLALKGLTEFIPQGANVRD